MIDCSSQTFVLIDGKKYAAEHLMYGYVNSTWKWGFLVFLSISKIILSLKNTCFRERDRKQMLHLLCPMSESPSGKREGFQDSATHKKGSLLLTWVRAPTASNAVVWGQRAPSLSCYTNL